MRSQTTYGKSNFRLERAAVVAAGCLVAPNAFAYLDPGTGSMIIQGLIAGIAMAGVTIRMYWHKVQAFFGAGSAQEDSQEPETTAESEQKSQLDSPAP